MKTDSGLELREEFDKIQSAVAAEYDKATDGFDSCGGGIECEKNDYWMLLLKDKSRRLISYWEWTDGPGGITRISVSANASSITAGLSASPVSSQAGKSIFWRSHKYEDDTMRHEY